VGERLCGRGGPMRWAWILNVSHRKQIPIYITGVGDSSGRAQEAF